MADDDQAPAPEQVQTRIDSLEQRAKEARAFIKELEAVADQCESEVRRAREEVSRADPAGNPPLEGSDSDASS